MHRWLGWLLVGLAACDDVSVEGTVDGEEVGGARDAIYDILDLEVPFVGDIEFTVVVLSDTEDFCEVTQAFADADEDAEDCEELCTAYLQVVEDFDLDPESFWTLMLSVNTSDAAEGAFDFEELVAEEGEFTASFSRFDASDLSDQSLCESACEDIELLEAEVEVPESGTTELEAVSDEELPGTFTLEFDGGDALEGSFEADRCDLSDLF